MQQHLGSEYRLSLVLQPLRFPLNVVPAWPKVHRSDMYEDVQFYAQVDQDEH